MCKIKINLLNTFCEQKRGNLLFLLLTLFLLIFLFNQTCKLFPFLLAFFSSQNLLNQTHVEVSTIGNHTDTPRYKIHISVNNDAVNYNHPYPQQRMGILVAQYGNSSSSSLFLQFEDYIIGISLTNYNLRMGNNFNQVRQEM